MGPIGSAVLTFIRYKQTDKQSIYIDVNFHFKGVICPGLSISCAMCGLYAPATCGAACTAAGLYCGFGGYACADAAAAAAAEAAAGPAVFK